MSAHQAVPAPPKQLAAAVGKYGQQVGVYSKAPDGVSGSGARLSFPMLVSQTYCPDGLSNSNPWGGLVQ